MKKEQVLEVLKQAINYREDGSCQSGNWMLGADGIEAVNTAIIALKKQIPQKVNNMDCCCVCGTYGKDDNDVSGDYCPNCGQKLDWV